MGTNETNKELEWKNHNAFFISLNQDLDAIKNVGTLVYDNTKYVKPYHSSRDKRNRRELC